MKKILFIFPFFIFCLAVLTACLDDDVEDDLNSLSQATGKVTVQKLVGTWTQIGNSDVHLYFTKNGEITYEREYPNDGIHRSDHNFKINEGIISYYDVKSKEKVGEEMIRMSKDTLICQSSNGKYTYKYLKTSSSEPDVFNVKPYDSYLYEVYKECYYPLYWAEMWMDHGGGTSSNSKYLSLGWADDKSYKPTSIVFAYFTPYYEGISAEWKDGTYIIKSSSDYWTYGVSLFYANNRKIDAEGGKLTISTKNSIKTIHYEDKEGHVVHFVGRV